MTSPSIDTGTGQLLVSLDGAVATLTFNNPAKRNALSSAIRAALPGTLKALNADDSVRVIVVTGAGGKAFVSGADISEFGDQRTSVEARATYDAEQAAIRDAWEAVGKPVIAMIQGFCIGGGLLTAMQADIRIASADSQFGIPAARLGLGYGPSGVNALMSLVGPAYASEILFSARRFSAEEALRMGLVNRVVPADDLRPVVMSLARGIAENAPLTVAAAKAGIRAARQPEAERDLATVNQMVEACFCSADYLEGQRAFAEKRPPKFTGQ